MRRALIARARRPSENSREREQRPRSFQEDKTDAPIDHRHPGQKRGADEVQNAEPSVRGGQSTGLKGHVGGEDERGADERDELEKHRETLPHSEMPLPTWGGSCLARIRTLTKRSRISRATVTPRGKCEGGPNAGMLFSASLATADSAPTKNRLLRFREPVRFRSRSALSGAGLVFTIALDPRARSPQAFPASPLP